jgi:hypothetical protein
VAKPADFVSLGASTATSDDFEDVADRYRQSLAAAREVRHSWGEAHSLDLLAAALQHVEGKEAARVCWQEALEP